MCCRDWGSIWSRASVTPVSIPAPCHLPPPHSPQAAFSICTPGCSRSACLWESLECRSQYFRCGLIRCLSTTLILFLVEPNVFSGSSEKQQEGAREIVSAPPVEWKLVRDPLPDGSSSPSNSSQSSDLSEPAESQQQCLPKPKVPFPGFLCPFQDLCASPQEEHSVQIEREAPEGKERGRQG